MLLCIMQPTGLTRWADIVSRPSLLCIETDRLMNINYCLIWWMNWTLETVTCLDKLACRTTEYADKICSCLKLIALWMCVSFYFLSYYVCFVFRRMHAALWLVGIPTCFRRGFRNFRRLLAVALLNKQLVSWRC